MKQNRPEQEIVRFSPVAMSPSITAPDRKISRRATSAPKMVSASAGRWLMSRRNSGSGITKTRPASVTRQFRKRRWPVNSVNSPTKLPGPNTRMGTSSASSDRRTSTSPSSTTNRS